MGAKDMFSGQVLAGWLLILSGLIFLPSGILYTGRAIWKWPAAQTGSYLYWERGLVMGAILVLALGFILLARFLVEAGDSVTPLLALGIFLTGTILVIAAESFSLFQQEYIYPPIVIFVVLAFLGQAAFGASILRTGLLPAWVGWATVIWNLVWLIILPIARPQDIYFPWLHYVAPLIIGISLLVVS